MEFCRFLRSVKFVVPSVCPGFNNKCEEMCQFFKKRGYPDSAVTTGKHRAQEIDRETAKSQKIEYLFLFCIELKLSTVVMLLTKFHDMSIVTFSWQHNGPQALSIQRGKLEFSSLKKCYLLLLFNQWV